MTFPVDITDLALEKLIAARDSDDDLDSSFAIRITCKSGGCAGFRHELDFDDEVADNDERKEITFGGSKITVVSDLVSSKFLKGVTLNYVEDSWDEGFKFEGGDFLTKSCACGSSVAYDCPEVTDV